MKKHMLPNSQMYCPNVLTLLYSYLPHKTVRVRYMGHPDQMNKSATTVVKPTCFWCP